MIPAISWHRSNMTTNISTKFGEDWMKTVRVYIDSGQETLISILDEMYK